MRGNLFLFAGLEKSRQERRSDVRQCRTAYLGIRVLPKNGRCRVAIVAYIILRLETVRAAAGFPDVRLVGDLPKADSRPSIPVVLDQMGNEAFPLWIVVRLDDIMVDCRKKQAGFEANA